METYYFHSKKFSMWGGGGLFNPVQAEAFYDQSV